MGKQRLSDASQRKGFSQTARSANIAPIIFLSVIAVVLAIAVALVLREVFQARELALSTAIERNECQERADQLLKQLNELESAYESLSRENSDLQSLSNQQQIEINRMRAQIRSVAGSQRIDEVRARIEQLEEELAEYQSQAKALLEEKNQLTSENERVKNTLAFTEEQVVELEVKNQGLTTQIQEASVLNIMNIEVITTRSARRGERETERARRVERIQVCFTILENILANPGNRNFYLRITGPNGQLLNGGLNQTFELLGNQVSYTATRAFEYNKQQQVACITYNPPDDLLDKGIYRVAIYAEGREVGTQLFELN
ncbi:MAG: hypothetical protein K0B09_03440 [Bacteroidales bacterium]|nr:hypothetical protein [Bacteroidales bacterium]